MSLKDCGACASSTSVKIVLKLLSSCYESAEIGTNAKQSPTSLVKAGISIVRHLRMLTFPGSRDLSV